MISFIVMKLRNYVSMFPMLLIMTCMTLVFVYVFGIGFSKGYMPKVLVVDEDQTQTSSMIVDRLMNTEKYHFVTANFNEAKVAVEKDDTIGFVYLKKGFEQSLRENKVDVIFYRGGSSVEIITLENKLDGLISEVLADQEFTNHLSLLLSEQEKTIASDEIYRQLLSKKSEYKTYQNQSSFYNKDEGVEYNTLKSTFTGFLLFFSMFTIMFGIGTIVDEKELKVWHRQLVSPLTKSTIIIGNLVSNYVIGMIQLLIIVTASKLLFSMDWGGTTGALLMILSAYVIAGTSMGLFITGFVKNQQQLAAILPTIIVSTSMIGGCMWPIELMPKFMRTVAQLLPQKWGMEGLSQVILYNGEIDNVVKPMLILLLISFIFLIASIIFYDRNEFE